MKTLITHKESDGTPITFDGSPLKNTLLHGCRDKAFMAARIKAAFSSQPQSQFWSDANDFVIKHFKR